MSMKRVYLILLTLILAGCSPPPNIKSISSPSTVSSTATAALPTIPKMGTVIVFTYTPKPPDTPTIIPSRTHVPPATPTFDVSTIVTHTPASPEKCPPGASVELPALERDPDNYRSSFKSNENAVVQYLNEGGSPGNLINRVRQNWESQDMFGKNEFIEDLTGDGVPEVLMIPSELYILGCRGGSYDILLKHSDEAFFFSGIKDQLVGIQDMNLNGIPEIVIASFGCGGMGAGQCMDVFVYEWDGKRFDSRLVEGGRVGASVVGGRMKDFLPTVDIEDSDKNGTKELILTGGIPSSWYFEYSSRKPWRDQSDTYAWDGHRFIYQKTTFSPPQYRYQAVQDGDRAMLNQEYDLALKSYQEAIFSDKLLGWSQAHKDREILMHDFTWDFGEKLKLTPTPSIPPDDPMEYPNLAAYARYRIMLLHILQGNLNEARIVYETLQQKFPEGSEGHVFALVAKTFWEEYNSSQDMSAACQAAIYVADKYQGYLHFLGSDYGNIEQDILYKPQDVCSY